MQFGDRFVNNDKRKEPRVSFDRGVSVRIMAIDGTWFRDCTMLDVSQSGVLLQTAKPLAGLELKEFFLTLSSTGVAFRRCQLSWVDGDRFGANFIFESKPNPKSNRLTKPKDAFVVL